MRNKMNINASALFFDIYGVVARCNMVIEFGGTEYFSIVVF